MIPEDMNSTEDVLRWCLETLVNGRLRVDATRRFMIGLSQLGQSLQWRAPALDCKYESLCGAFLDMCACSHQIGVRIGWQLKPYLTEFDEFQASCETMLLAVCTANRMLFYSSGSLLKSRKSRATYDKKLAAFSHLARLLIEQVPVARRVQAMEDCIRTREEIRK